MKKTAVIIVASALLITGCGSSGINNTTSSTVSETSSVSAETEAGVPGGYEYVGNSLKTSAEPIEMDRGYVAMLEDDLDEDGVDETIMLVTESDGEIMDFDIEIYESGKTGYELADTIHKELECDMIWSEDSGFPIKNRAYITNHVLQIQTQNYVQDNGEIVDVITPYTYKENHISEYEQLYYYWDEWRNESTKLVGSVSYLGYEKSDLENMAEMPSAYCVSLIDGTQLSTYESDDFTLHYPKMWDDFTLKEDFADDWLGGFKGTTFASNTLMSPYEDSEDVPYGLFSVGVAPLEEYIGVDGNPFPVEFFDTSGGRLRIWYGETEELFFVDGGDWMANLLGAEQESKNTEELLTLQCITEEAENIIPVLCSYSGNEDGQLQNPFVVDESGEKIHLEEESETDSISMEISGKDWKEAYLSVLHSDDQYLASNTEFALIYVDNDDIPEMVVNTNVEAGGCQIYTFHDGKGEGLQTSRLGFNYIEKGNLLCNSDGHMDSYYDKVFTIFDGKWKQIGDGTYSGYNEGFDDETGRYICSDYTWNGEEVSIDEYMDRLENIYDFDSAIEPQEYYSGEEMAELLGA